MGFFFEEPKKPKRTGTSARASGAVPTATATEMLRNAGCKACPLDKADCRSPKMKPIGPIDAPIYVLGKNPTKAADRENDPSLGRGLDLFRRELRKAGGSLRNIRYSNVVRTVNGGKVTPTMVECCRNSIIADIEATKPEAIFCLGEEPLRWAINMSNISKWSGRRAPVQIGTHTCWAYFFEDPLDILRKSDERGFEIEEQITFRFHVRDAVRQIRAGLPWPAVHSVEKATGNLTLLDGSGGADDLRKLATLLSYFAGLKRVGFDWETFPLRPYNRGSKILSFAISDGENALSVAVDHPGAKWSPRQRRELHNMICDWLYDAPCAKISHQLNFELEWAGAFYGRDVIRATPWEDTVTQAWVISEHGIKMKPSAHSLEHLTVQHFGLNVKKLSGVNRKDLRKEEVGHVIRYNAIDARYHYYLFMVQRDLIREQQLPHVYRAMRDRIPTMVLTQLKGIPVDQEVVKALRRRYTTEISTAESEIASMPECRAFKRRFGAAFQPGNPKDVLKMLESILDEDVTNKQGKVSSDEEVLERIGHPICKAILKLRGASKVLSTYIDPVDCDNPESVVFDDGLIHPVISTTRTLTSRTASEDPNQQNWPKHTSGKIVRKQIRPLHKDERVVSFDYGQIQARNIAQECLDEAYIKTFWDKHDIHKDWAHRCVELAPKWPLVGSAKKFLASKELQKTARSKIKNGFVFPTFFGAQPRSISISLDVDQRIIDKMQGELFGQFPGIHAWQERLREHFKEHGFIQAVCGVIRRAPCAINQLINAPIQADETAIVCDAMTRLSKLGWDYQASMEIHDDLTFIWHKDEIDTLAPIVIREMVNVPFEWAHIVPMVVEMSIGHDWHDSEEVGVFSSADYDKVGYSRKKEAAQ